jgi:hypothetical protein
MIAGEAHQHRNSIWNPIIQEFYSWMCKRIFGRMTKITDVEVIGLLGFDCQAANRPLGVLPLHVGYLLKTGYYKEPRASLTRDFPWI